MNQLDFEKLDHVQNNLYESQIEKKLSLQNQILEQKKVNAAIETTIYDWSNTVMLMIVMLMLISWVNIHGGWTPSFHKYLSKVIAVWRSELGEISLDNR